MGAPWRKRGRAEVAGAALTTEGVARVPPTEVEPAPRFGECQVSVAEGCSGRRSARRLAAPCATFILPATRVVVAASAEGLEQAHVVTVGVSSFRRSKGVERAPRFGENARFRWLKAASDAGRQEKVGGAVRPPSCQLHGCSCEPTEARAKVSRHRGVFLLSEEQSAFSSSVWRSGTRLAPPNGGEPPSGESTSSRDAACHKR